MVCSTQNHWVFRLCPSFGILNLYNTQRFGNWICFRLRWRQGLNRVGVSLSSPKDGNRSSFCKVVLYSYLEFLTMDAIHKPSDSESVEHLFSLFCLSALFILKWRSLSAVQWQRVGPSTLSCFHPGPPVRRSLRWDSKIWPEFCGTSVGRSSFPRSPTDCVLDY
jgi:hypothetical protein